MKFAIHGRAFAETSRTYISEIFKELASHNVQYQVSEVFAEILRKSEIDFHSDKTFNSPDSLDFNDLALSIGGDGSFLETLEFVARKSMPVLGINFGRLGFLTDIEPQNIKKTISDLVAHNYAIDERIMLKAEASSELFEMGMNFALNEIAISKTDTSSMIVIHAYVDDQFLNSYWADGLMVATPTGSTGYSLSCGGPLVMPDSENFIITPICPHNLFVRPIIVSSKSVIKLKVETRSNNFLLSMDSRARIIGNEIGEITVSLEKSKAKLVKMEGSEFFTILRKKLKWGEDVRNRP
jgi:NAD+ kinase